MITRPVTDAQRNAFLESLDTAAFEVTSWEARFIESNLESFGFSRDQREVIDKLWEKYGSRLHG